MKSLRNQTKRSTKDMKDALVEASHMNAGDAAKTVAAQTLTTAKDLGGAAKEAAGQTLTQENFDAAK